MVVPAHVGFEHPNLLWIVVVGIAAFAVGLGVNLARSDADEGSADVPADEPGE